MGIGSKANQNSMILFVLNLWGIRHVRAIWYLLWLFLWWYKFDNSVRLSFDQGRINRFYDIWYGKGAKEDLPG